MKTEHYYVYVIEMGRQVLSEKRFLGDNPQIKDPTTCKMPLYVGMTGLTPEKRFANHMSGHKSRGFAHKYGIRLLPEMYEHLNLMDYEAAKNMEKDYAKDLRRQGHPVWQR